MMLSWNPWHGCHQISPGCQNCYVYRGDAQYGRNPREVVRTAGFDLPLRRTRGGGWKLPPGEEVFTCGTSDFFVEEADAWRAQAWAMIRMREDLSFLIITKRIHRFAVGLPDDWGAGYPNVAIGCTAENQDRADFRLPLFLDAPIRHRIVICEPLLGPVSLGCYLADGRIDSLVAGGESGEQARVCDYDWILSLRRQCMENGVPFTFKQTGARLRKAGRMYRIPRRQQHVQARRANINWLP